MRAALLALALTGCANCVHPVLVTVEDDRGAPRTVDRVTWERFDEGERDCDGLLREGLFGHQWHCGPRLATDRAGEWRIRAYVTLTQDVYSDVAEVSGDDCADQAAVTLSIP